MLHAFQLDRTFAAPFDRVWLWDDGSGLAGRSAGHALVDFRPRWTEECLDRAKNLHRCALARGWEHGPMLPV